MSLADELKAERDRRPVDGGPLRIRPESLRISSPRALARFLSKIEMTRGCWTWTGGGNGTSGYGMAFVPGPGSCLAHRVAWETFVAPIPRGLTIDHLCCNRRCVNPLHLEPVTHGENVSRVSRRRRESAK